MRDIIRAQAGTITDGMVLAAIREIRRRCPTAAERLEKFRLLKSITEARHRDGAYADVLADVRLCIDEIELRG